MLLFLRPSFIKLIPAIIVGVGWTVNVALAYIKGAKILKSKKEKSHD